MMDDFRELPHDLAAERVVLGSCMQTTRALDGLQLTPADFYRAAHQTTFALIQREHAAGRPIDPAALRAALGKNLDKVGGPLFLTDCLAEGNPLAVGHFAAIVSDRSRRRALIEAAARANQLAYGDEDAEVVINAIHDAITKIKYASMATDDLESLLTYEEFVGQAMPEQVLVCGDLLALGERLVITGTEGTGKTVLSRQMAVACAAGMHPFQMTPCTPKRVLALDLENPLDIMARSWRKLGNYAERRGLPIHDGRLMIDRRPSGLDLASVADQRWLSRRVETVRPDLLVIGPVYKMYIGGSNDREEDRARLVTAFLDKLRESTGCALILEHHSPHRNSALKHRDLRPIGSSLWLRWPEFGYGIRYTDDEDAQDDRRVHFLPWRGARDERPWPRQLEADKRGGWGFVEVPPDRQRTGWAS